MEVGPPSGSLFSTATTGRRMFRPKRVERDQDAGDPKSFFACWISKLGCVFKAVSSEKMALSTMQGCCKDLIVAAGLDPVIGCVTAMKTRLHTLLHSRRSQANAVGSYAKSMKGVTCDTSAS
jgi:hypothetical protein